MPNLIASWVSFWGLGKETTYKTGVVPSVYWSTKAKWTDIYDELVDEGFRGTPGADQVLYQGIRESTFDVPATEFYPDTWGHALMGLNGVDAVTGTNPYIHTIGAATGLPPSYTITDYSSATSGGNARQLVGCYVKSLDLHWVDNGKFTVAPSYIGVASSTVAKPTNSYSALNPFISWQGALTLGGSSNTKMREINLKIERLEAQNVPGSSGSQDPSYGFVGQLRVTGTATFGVTDETEYNYYVNNTQPTFSLLLTQSANVTLTIQMSKLAFTKSTVIDRGKQFLTTVAAVKAITNTTDIATGGAAAAPILFILKNAQSTGY